MKVHRCRFVKYTPSTINAGCFMKVKGSNDSFHDHGNQQYVVIGRENGDIEFYNTGRAMLLESTLSTSYPIQSICSTSQGLLVTAHFDGYLRLWDWQRKLLLHQFDVSGGPIWSISSNTMDDTKIACGCDDGSVKIVEVCPSKLEFLISTDKQDGKILSVQWDPQGTRIAASTSSGFLNIFSGQTGSNLKRIRVNNHPSFESRYIWSLVWLSQQNTVVCGDALGAVSFWNVSFGTMIQKIITHQADVLTLAYDPLQQAIYASGIDSKVVRIELLKQNGRPAEESSLKNKNGEIIFYKNWIISNSLRIQSHDVKMLLYANCNKKSYVVAGGADANVYFYDSSDFIRYNSMQIPHFTAKSRMISFSKSRLMFAVNMTTFVDIWTWNELDQPIHSCKVFLPEQQSVQECVISDCGSILAASSLSNAFFFSLKWTDSGISSISRLSSKISFPAFSQLQFLPKCSQFFSLNESSNSLLSYSYSSSAITLLKVFNTFDEKVSLFTIHFSGKWLAIKFSNGNVFIYSLEGDLKCLYKIPQADGYCHLLQFFPNKPYLFIGTTSNSFSIFNVISKDYIDWSKRNPYDKFPTQWLNRKEKIRGIFFAASPHSKNRKNDEDEFYIWSGGYICKVNLNADFSRKRQNVFPMNKRPVDGSKPDVKNFKESTRFFSGPFTVTTEFNAVLGASINEDGSLLVIERPWIEIHKSLPPVFNRKRFNQ